MALRIGPPAAPLVMPEQTEAISEPAVMPEPTAPEMTETAMPPVMGDGLVQKELVKYVGPERMEMSCMHCIHFMEPGSCEIVGSVDPGGTCILFVRDSMAGEMPAETDMAPVEDDTEEPIV